VYQIRTMQDRMAQSLARRRFSSTMLAAFALFALLLASVGVYGVMSYFVVQSRHDVGLRVALGARPRDILRLVVSQGMGLAAAGILVGLAGAAALTRLMSSLLFGIRATDAATFGSVAAILAAAAFLATVIPALRATRVDPIVALREE
jgi:ABC-type antimicrobial peptide transport system permease subunit